MPLKDSTQKMLVVSMLLSFGLAITSFINGVLSLLLKGGEYAARTFYISFCFALAGILFRKTIKRNNK
ncbi:MAG: hypothetical protein FWG13_06780 [Leptospirales bacterium]|nr:hypothetical protein [Leptospirales bacterium]